ncbi:response regulator [Chitinimonas arctica]|uniref:Chemotaxis protein CheA n=1 Tax=Chitinimonas arctica TaxID=2594795 RepID=A0A516SEJ5_9NEIS|nr:response regulator [Chitinimonas arctica]QDQ26571.1 response regulator [Chitinimonas arctica]
MAENEARFLERLMATFLVEADEHLQAMVAALLELERDSDSGRRQALVEELFREAHSLKGAARSVSRHDLERLCSRMETRLAELKHGQAELSPEVFEACYQDLTVLESILHPVLVPASSAAATPGTVSAPLPEPPLAKPATSVGPPNPAATAAPADETVRVSTSKLNTLLNQAEELLSLKFSAAHLLEELAELNRELSDWKKERNKTVRELRALRRAWGRRQDGLDETRLAQLHRLLDVVDGDELRLRLLEERVLRLRNSREQERRALTGMVDGLLDDMKQASMLPLSSLLALLPKLVRDQAKDSGKEVELTLTGGSLEIDRRILEQLKDPLIHLLRNAVDHGIEAPRLRQQQGKPERGSIEVAASPRDGNQIELTIRDDGAGIRLDSVRQSARRMGLLGPDDAGTESMLLNLVFESGLSTSPILTDISGRGLGLAIVREKVEKLGGSVRVEAGEEGGSCFRILLPTTLATFRGMLVRAGEQQFVLPSTSVERAVRVDRQSILTVENRETITLEGSVLGVVWLVDILEMPRKESTSAVSPYLQAVVLGAGQRRIAFIVDEIVDDREVLVKGLGPQLQRVRNVAGATVLGAGRVVPILNVGDLLKSAVRYVPVTAAPTATVRAERKSVLVAEDSITSRSLLKNILESAGYATTTAVDGIDALTLLRTSAFDLLVSDVEMPRMDGFDLISRIRQEPKLRELPVILVTALDSREDRERGIDVGANAYIVKGGFDQSNLLDAIRRLI